MNTRTIHVSVPGLAGLLVGRLLALGFLAGLLMLVLPAVAHGHAPEFDEE